MIADPAIINALLANELNSFDEFINKIKDFNGNKKDDHDNNWSPLNYFRKLVDIHQIFFVLNGKPVLSVL